MTTRRSPDHHTDRHLAQRIAVVTPVHGRHDTLPRALRSLGAQTFPHWASIVVDDASDPPILGVVEDLDLTGSVDVVRLESRSGAAAARNAGIARSDAELVAFLDSDDEWHPRKLEAQVQALAESGADAAYCGYRVVGRHGTVPGSHAGHEGDLYELLLTQRVVVANSSVVVRRSVLEEVGGFDPTLAARHDYDLWLRVARNHRFVPVPERLVTLHGSSDAISRDVERRYESDRRVLERLLAEDLRDAGARRRAAVRSAHEYHTARYCQLAGSFGLAVRHAVAALVRRPWTYRAWLVLVGSLLRRPMSEENRLLRRALSTLRAGPRDRRTKDPSAMPAPHNEGPRRGDTNT